MNHDLHSAGTRPNRPGSASSDPGSMPSVYPSAPVAVTHLGIAALISAVLWGGLIALVAFAAEVVS